MSFYKRTIDDISIRNKTILLRADYNVPLSDNGRITNEYRLQASLPTLRQLLKHNCKIVIISHLGRPHGKRVEGLSLEPVAKRLSELLGNEVRFIDDTIGHKVKTAIKSSPLGSVTMLENLRFCPGEESNDESFAEALAEDSRAEYFVQDGFSVVHRAHASTEAITHYLPSVAGYLVEREYEFFTTALMQPKRPLVALLGGAKIGDKIQIIKRFIKLADQVIIGGAMANTFLEYNGKVIGKSVYELGQHGIISDIYDAVEKKVGEELADNFLILPSDVAVAGAINATEPRRVVGVNEVSPDDYILDIGPETIERMANAVSRAQTALWNGTLGMTELPEFAHGSARAALALAESRGISIIGGGDTVGFVLDWDSRDGASFTHVSTGGGATLDLVAGKKLPGIESLLDA